MRLRSNLRRVVLPVIALLSASSVCATETDCFTELRATRGPGMGPLLNNVKLNGVAKGGELVLLEMLNSSPRYIKINTQAGESAEVVIARMAAAINKVSPFNPDLPQARVLDEKGQMVRGDLIPIVRAEGNLLKSFGGAPGSHVFAGTETGLGIPPPPTSLSISYNPQTQEVSLHWENPNEPYDAVRNNFGGIQDGNVTTASAQSGPPRKQDIPPGLIARGRLRDNKGLRRFHVIGCRDGVLSNAAVITLNYEDNSQEELDALPFTGGIAPNWRRWSSGETQMLLLEQGVKGEWKRFDQEPKAALAPGDKPLYQVIKTRSVAVTGGVCRKFLGLKPGHTYRLWTRINTFEMDKAEENWSFSFHAIPHDSKLTLTPEQMAGTAPLPDGSSGGKAGQIVYYGPGATTKGQFAECRTGEQGSDSQARDITLPPGAEVITVWFRLSGAAASGVGFDWIKLKDVTASH
ncbi:MAG: hypothetical protein JW955_00020 [Sedimentisphaerales bacterium]|nr:hypothetical protein [Sedimentisphaerales bacterium]